jgi:hypothetical protein
MSMFPPASVGGTESTIARVSRATPMVPMNGARSKPTGTSPGSRPRSPLLARCTDAKTLMLPPSLKKGLLAGLPRNRSGYSPGSAPLPSRFEITP